jgi:hypothetical protein
MPVKATLGTAYTRARCFRGEGPLTVSGDLTWTQSMKDTVGLESFLEQKVQPMGERARLGLHLGGEGEILPRRLRLRVGSYFEPSRFRGVAGRWHGTGGAEIRLFRFDFIGEHHVSLSYAVDIARDYALQIVSLGFWRFSNGR